MFFLKRQYAVLPMCFGCKGIFFLQSIIINNSNDVQLRYRCDCLHEKKIDINKYLYGLQLLSEIINWNQNFNCFFCLKCEHISFSASPCKHIEIMLKRNKYLELCQEHDECKKNYICMDCHANECKDCILKYHNEHKNISIREYYDNIENNIVNKLFTNVDDYILKKFQVNKQLLERLKILYHLFIFSFKLIKSNPNNYKLCKSIENLTHIEIPTSTSNIKVIYHQKNILKIIGGNYYKEDKFQLNNEEFYYSVIQGFMLSNGSLLLKYHLYPDDSFHIKDPLNYAPDYSYFVLYDSFFNEIYYKNQIKNYAFAFHIKEDIYCFGGDNFCMILDLSQNKAKVLNKYRYTDFNLTNGLTFKNKILVYSKKCFYLFQLNDKFKDFKIYKSAKKINNIIYYKNNLIIIVYETSFAIFDYTKRKEIISLPIRKSQNNYPYSSSFLLNKYLFIFRDLGHFSNYEYTLVFDIEKKKEYSKKYFFPCQSFRSCYRYNDDTFVGVSKLEFIHMFDLESGCTLTTIDDEDANNYPSILIKLKYGFYLHINNFTRFTLYLGRD